MTVPTWEDSVAVEPKWEDSVPILSKKGLIRRGAEAIVKSPALPITGAIAGTVGGSGIASIPLAGLGAAGGESIRQLAARGLGMEAPETSLEALKGIGGEALSGMAGQALFMGAGKALTPIVKPTARAIGKGLAGGLEKITGISSQATESAFKNPLRLFTAPTKKTVEKAYEVSEFPSLIKNADEVIEAGTSSHAGVVKRGAKAIKKFIEEGSEHPKDILEGRKGLDKQIALLNNQIDTSKGPGKSALLQAKNAKLELRGMFNRALDKMAPKLREADKLASENLSIEPFRKVTLPGKINFMSPEGLLRGVPGLPTAIGATVSAAGAAKKAIANPFVGKVVSQGIAQITKTLTKDKAKEFLREAKGNKDEARRLAREAGYEIPKKKK